MARRIMFSILCKFFTLYHIADWRSYPTATRSGTTWSKPNELVHMDILHMILAERNELQYALEMKDDLSSYSWLLRYGPVDSKAAVDELSKLIAAFGKMVWTMTDRRAHFTAPVMEGLTQDAGINHHLTTLYCL